MDVMTPHNSQEPAADGALRSAVAGVIMVRRGLSFDVGQHPRRVLNLA